MARPRKARVEGASVEVPVAAVEFAEFVECFKREFPEDWEALKLCPLQHGLEAMIERFK